MNIIRENNDDLNLVLKIQVEKADYEERVNKELSNYRRKANIPGFRPGKAPMPFVKKIAWRSLLIEEINKIVGDSLYKHVADEKLKILGEPLPSIQEQKPIDWEHQESFEFAFDLAVMPEWDLKLTKKDKCSYYIIKVEDKFIDSTVDNHTRRYGKSIDVEEAGEKDIVRGEIHQLDENGELTHSGICNHNALISVEYVKDKNIQSKFIGLKAEVSIDFDIESAFDQAELAYILGLKKEQTDGIKGKFRFTANSVSRFVPAGVDQTLFDQVYGAGVVNSVEEYRNKVSEEIARTFIKESDFKFSLDIKKKILDKLDLKLPDEFLKRWLKISNKEITEEQLENEFPAFRTDLIWQMIKDKISHDNEIKVEESEIIEYARQATLAQFANYGLYNLPEENVNSFAREILTKPEEKNKIVSKLTEDKIISYLKGAVKLDEKEITSEEFNKLFTE